jgi:hypothetical protein
MKKVLLILGLLIGILANSQTWNTTQTGSKTTQSKFLGVLSSDSGYIVGSVSSLTNCHLKTTLGSLVVYQDSLYYRGVSSWINLTRGGGVSANVFVKGGNSFGSNAYLGTNDNYSLFIGARGRTTVQFSENGGVYGSLPTYDAWFIDSINACSFAGGSGIDHKGNFRVSNNDGYIYFSENGYLPQNQRFGFRDSAGLIQFKDSIGSWESISSSGTNIDTNRIAFKDKLNVFTGLNDFRLGALTIPNYTEFYGDNNYPTYFNIINNGVGGILNFKPVNGDTVAYQNYVDSIVGTKGTVSSITLTTPTGLQVNGSSSQTITSAGTFPITYTSGYSLPTTASQTLWDAAYTNRITSATSPLNITSNVLSIAQASSTLNGYLSSTDWNTFNSKATTSQVASKLDTSGAYINTISINADALYNAATYSRTDHVGYVTQNLATQSANKVFASPNGSTGTPTFRSLVSTDVPTLNQNTTGSAASLTTGRTIGITGDLTYTSPSFDGSANVTAVGTLNTGISPTWTGFHTFSRTVTASGGIARGTLFNSTLTAAANGDVSVGLDIPTTFTNGAFTGVANLGIRASGFSQFGTATTNSGIILGSASSFTTGSVPTSGFTIYKNSSDGVFYHGNGGGFYFKFRTSANADANNRLYIADAGIGVNTGATAPTAKILIGAGTASANTAPLKFTSGVNLSTVENGAVEYDGTDYFVTANSQRQTLHKGKFGSFSGVGTATTTFTVTFGGTQPNATYKVNVTPTSSLSAALFYVTNKTTTTFDVMYLAGLTGTITFDYSLIQ